MHLRLHWEEGWQVLRVWHWIFLNVVTQENLRRQVAG